MFSGGEKKRRRPAPIAGGDESTHRLQRQLEKGAQSLSLRRLQKQGLSSVRVINASTIQGIVNEAVDEALRLRDVALSGEELRQVQDMARAQLGELLEENRRLTERVDAASVRRGELEDLVNQLGIELHEQQQHLEEERSRQVLVEVSDESFSEMERRLRLICERMIRDGDLAATDDGLDVAPLTAELEKAITRLVDEAREGQQSEAAHDRDVRIHELELRIEKLNGALVQAETNLHRVAAAAIADAGVASIYEAIQGLDSSDPAFERKSELLGEVFLQNLEIQGVDVTDEDIAAAGVEDYERQRPAPPPPSPEPEPDAPRKTESGLVIPKGFGVPVQPFSDESAF